MGPLGSPHLASYPKGTNMADKKTVEVSFRALGRFYPQGTEVDADDPAVAKYPAMFAKSAGAVRTTAAVPGDVVDPAAVVTGRPAQSDTKAQWRAYVEALGGSPGELTKAELQDLADELEG